MGTFNPRWILSNENTSTHELTKLTNPPSVSSDSPSLGGIHVSKESEWIDARIYQEILLGRPKKIWSRTLDCWVYWVRDDRVKEILESKDAEAVVYTLAEIQILIDQCCGSDDLRAIHELKKCFIGAKIVKEVETHE